MIVATEAKRGPFGRILLHKVAMAAIKSSPVGMDLQTKDKRECSANERDHCTDTVISEPDAAVNCWSGCTTAALVIFTGKRPVAFAWKVRVATTP